MKLKKLISVILATGMVFALAACGSAPAATGQETQNSAETSSERVQKENNTESSVQSEGSNDSKILIAYFSRAGENYNVGTIEKGNTEIIAEMIAEATGGDLFHIQTVNPYPENYMEMLAVAQQEYDDSARPELADEVQNMADYDVVFLGYPIWWSGLPMAMHSFMESYDFTGKKIIPFNTHEGSGQGETQAQIEDALPGVTILDGLAVQGQTAQNDRTAAQEAVTAWLQKGGFID